MDDGTAVLAHGQTHGDAPGHAWPPPLQHGCAAWCTAVRYSALFLSLLQGFVRLPIFLETASKVLLFIKIHEFLLKV